MWIQEAIVRPPRTSGEHIQQAHLIETKKLTIRSHPVESTSLSKPPIGKTTVNVVSFCYP